jgi:hypothetical protein
VKAQSLAPCLSIAAALALAGCAATLKTIDLPAQSLFATSIVGGGAFGFCYGADDPPPTSFSPGPGELLVGFDDWRRPGAPPFPCDTVRDVAFRSGIAFDLAKFKTVVNAELLFDTANSVTRAGGETTSQQPPQSAATALGLAVKPLGTDPGLLDEEETALASSTGSQDINVTAQVREWLSGSRANNGFVLSGPLPAPTEDAHPSDNDAKVSWERNFRLRLQYDPSKNPGAPQ